jgi:hypothetical protein
MRNGIYSEVDMRLNDLFDLENGPAALVKLALYPLILVVVWQALTVLLCKLSFTGILVAFAFVLLLSPLAYFTREARGHGRERGGGRRGGERTPVLPTNEERG